jgi:hypothetical protein
MINLYHRLSNKSVLRNFLNDYLKNNNISFVNRHGLLTHNIRLELCIFDETVKFLADNTKIFHATIFKMLPMTAYHWHTDTDRSCALNLLLTNNDSHTFIETHQNREIIEYIEIPYEEDNFYLINTDQKHCVFNRQDERYLFTLGFDRSYSFETVKNICIENNL